MRVGGGGSGISPCGSVSVADVPEGEQQSVSRGELRGVLHAFLQRRAGQQLVVMMDSLYWGIVEWSAKWCPHGWRTSSGEVGH